MGECGGFWEGRFNGDSSRSFQTLSTGESGLSKSQAQKFIAQVDMQVIVVIIIIIIITTTTTTTTRIIIIIIIIIIIVIVLFSSCCSAL
jgi:hypothetical protein